MIFAGSCWHDHGAASTDVVQRSATRLPVRRLLLMIALPLRVFIRARKPTLRIRLILLTLRG